MKSLKVFILVVFLKVYFRCIWPSSGNRGFLCFESYVSLFNFKQQRGTHKYTYRQWKKERESEGSIYRISPQMSLSTQGCAGLKPRAENPIWYSNVGSRCSSRKLEIGGKVRLEQRGYVCNFHTKYHWHCLWIITKNQPFGRTL